MCTHTHMKTTKARLRDLLLSPGEADRKWMQLLTMFSPPSLKSTYFELVAFLCCRHHALKARQRALNKPQGWTWRKSCYPHHHLYYTVLALHFMPKTHTYSTAVSNAQNFGAKSGWQFISLRWWLSRHYSILRKHFQFLSTHHFLFLWHDRRPATAGRPTNMLPFNFFGLNFGFPSFTTKQHQKRCHVIQRLRIVKHTWNSHAARKRVINLCSFVCTDGNTVGHNCCMQRNKRNKQQFLRKLSHCRLLRDHESAISRLDLSVTEKLNNIRRSHFVFILLFHSFKHNLAQFLKTYCLRCDYKVSLKGRLGACSKHYCSLLLRKKP